MLRVSDSVKRVARIARTYSGQAEMHAYRLCAAFRMIETQTHAKRVYTAFGAIGNEYPYATNTVTQKSSRVTWIEKTSFQVKPRVAFF